MTKTLGETRLAVAIIDVAVTLFTGTPHAIWFEVVRSYNVVISYHTTLCHYFALYFRTTRVIVTINRTITWRWLLALFIGYNEAAKKNIKVKFGKYA